jgi:hypothetical protein
LSSTIPSITPISSASSSLHSVAGTCTIEIPLFCHYKNLLNNTSQHNFTHHYCYPSFRNFTLGIIRCLMTPYYFTSSLAPHFTDTVDRHCNLLRFLFQVLQFFCWFKALAFQVPIL